MSFRAAVAMSLLLLTLNANGTDAYPSKEVTLVVPTGAGGATDVISRIVAKSMSDDLKVPIVVVNKPGAGGMVGPAFVAQQPADGYRIGILLTSATELAPYISKVPFQLDDLQFVASIASYRFGLVVRSDSPFKSVKELVDASKKDGGTFFGASSISPGLGITRLGNITGSKFELVNYKSGVETVTELLAGRVQSSILQPADLLAHLKSGQLRLLASPGTNRWPEYPNVPTFQDLGYDVKLVSEIAIVAPAKTPREIVERLQKAAFTALDDPKVRSQYDNLGMDRVKRTGPEIRSIIYQNFKNNAPGMRALNSTWVPESCFVDCK